MSAPGVFADNRGRLVLPEFFQLTLSLLACIPNGMDYQGGMIRYVLKHDARTSRQPTPALTPNLERATRGMLTKRLVGRHRGKAPSAASLNWQDGLE